MDLYELARGPLASAAFAIFAGGTLVRIYLLLSNAKRLNRLNPEKSRSGGTKSIVKGLLPYGLSYMRQNPLFTAITFIFHLCVLLLPVLLLAHTVLIYESWNLQWVSLPDGLADGMAMAALAAVIFFGVRRVLVREVRELTNTADWVILGVVGGVLLSGLVAYHQWGSYRSWLIAHVLLADLLLVMIPFTKLVHMALFPLTRGYLGAEYEIVLDTKYL